MRKTVLVAVLAVVSILAAASQASAYSYSWGWTGGGSYTWVSRESGHLYSFIQAYDSDCINSVLGNNCTTGELLGERARRVAYPYSVYGGEAYGYPRANQHYTPGYSIYPQLNDSGSNNRSGYAEW